MGRCYEFGVVITEGCDHAMVVPAEGGKCVCSGCGADCLGRFNGCASIISQPGYVPLLAPASALVLRPEVAEQRPTTAGTEEQTTARPTIDVTPPSTMPAVPDSTEFPTEAEDALLRMLGAPEVTLAKVERLEQQLALRDKELALAFQKFTEALHRVGELLEKREATGDAASDNVQPLLQFKKPS